MEALAALAQAGPAPPPKSCCECRSEDEVTESIEFNFRDGKEGEQEIEEFHSEGGDQRLVWTLCTPDKG